MSRKNVVSLLAFNAVVNALLINLRILHVINLNWWLVFLPTWFSVLLIVSKIARDVSAKVKYSSNNDDIKLYRK